MVRTRRRFAQLPTMTILLLVLLATLPLFKVSSSGDTGDVPAVAQQEPAAIIIAPSAADRQDILPPSVGAGMAVTAHQPVAQLVPPPDGLQSVAFVLGDGGARPILPDGATPIATGRYTTSDHVIVVTTAGVRTGGAPSSLGARSLALPDGSSAWATPGLVGKTTNQVSLVRDGLIVIVASDLPIETLASLTANVVIRW